jgi:hypothetical protein
VKGLTVASHGTSIGERLAGGPGRYEIVGRQTPGSVPPVKGGGGGFGKLPSLARKAMMLAAVCWPTPTPGSFSARPLLNR